MTVRGEFIAGEGGDASVIIGSSNLPVTSVSTGSTLLGSEAGSTARVVIQGAPAGDSLQYFYAPSNYTWRVDGKGETNKDNLVAGGDASLSVESGLIFIDENGVFSMGAQNASDPDYISGTKGALGIAYFGSGAELRMNNGTFVNNGSGLNSTIGKIIFVVVILS